MTKVVMVTLTRWDDHGSMVSQEEIDQDVADEVNEGVDSKLAQRKERLVIFKEEWVGGWARVTADEDRVLCRVWKEIKLYR